MMNKKEGWSLLTLVLVTGIPMLLVTINLIYRAYEFYKGAL